MTNNSKRRASNAAALPDWDARWRDQRIGFHKADVNEKLRQHVDVVASQVGARILVPLCGKSVDMHWLAAEHEAHVVGVEWVDEAAAACFAQHQLAPSVDTAGPFTRRRADIGKGSLELLTGDIFALHELGDAYGNFDAIYDRAAIVALSAKCTAAYCEVLKGALGEGGSILMITLDYDSSEMQGPPFAVSDDALQDALAPLRSKKLTVEAHRERPTPEMERWELSWIRYTTWHIAPHDGTVI